MPNIEFEQALSEYKSQHQTAGCIITHMVGVPLLALSLPLALLNLRKSLACFVFGWALQLVGHYYFEKNSPVLFTKSGKSLWVPIVALYMVGTYWRAVLTGNAYIGHQNGKDKLLTYRQ